jgi:hypothetical protein
VGHRFKKGNKRMLTSFERSCGVSDGWGSAAESFQKGGEDHWHFGLAVENGGSRFQNPKKKGTVDVLVTLW